MDTPVNSTVPTRPVLLWPVPLFAAGLMLLGGAAAAYLSMRLELVPTCNPLIEGCVSISRAGRHGLANIVFRAFILPSAITQALMWWLCARWLESQTTQRSSAPSWLGVLGVLAGAFLVVYGSFLGTDGIAYRWLRQYGTIFYFGCSYVCMLLLLAEMARLQTARYFVTTLKSLCSLLLLLGLGNVFLARLFDDGAKDRIENITEWWLCIGYVAVFVLLADLWRRRRVALAWIRL